jgi:YidC/Oxa1 family membrane protein insertase
MGKINWKRLLTTWVVVFLVLMVVSNWLGGKDSNAIEEDGILTVKTTSSDYDLGQEVSVRVRNNSEETITIASNCPQNPFNVRFWDGETFVDKTAATSVGCEHIDDEDIILEAGAQKIIPYTYWNNAIFEEVGRYRIDVPITIGEKEQVFTSEEFLIEPRGVLRKTWDTLFYRPILNLLIWITNAVPGKNLGIGIIAITILIRLILLVPSQRAMKSQRRLQEVQPKLDAIKNKYKGNQERIAQETMKIWKTEKVNPFGSCLPLLIQFPFLIAIFYVVRSGLNPDQSHLLYESLRNFDFTQMETLFLGTLELTKINIFVLPLIVGLLQFGQMKLAMPKRVEGQKNEMQMATSMMMYVMPVMIAIFTASVPAGVGLYWGTSTTFALGQQIVVNRGKLKKAQ